MAKNLKNIEKQFKAEQKRLQNQIVTDDEDEVVESKSIENMSAMERLKAIRKGEMEVEKEEKVDLKDQTDVMLEQPLPRTLTCDYLPIEKIVNGVIYTEDNRYVRLVEVLPVNFLLKAPEEQTKIIHKFIKFLRSAPEHFQILSFATKTDMSKFIAKIDEDIEKETNAGCIALQKDYKNLVMKIGATQATTRRFFVVLEYKKRAGITPTKNEIETQLETTRQRLLNYLSKCGNKVLTMEHNTQETCKILFEILNRSESGRRFHVRMQDVVTHYKENYGEDSLEQIPVTEYFAPEKINFKNYNFTKIGDTYYDFAFIRSDGYPTEIPAGWTSILVNASEGIDVKLDIKREDRKKSKERIGRNIRINANLAKDAASTSDEFERLSSSVSSGRYLNEGLRQNQDLYYFTMLITITGRSLEELEWRRREFYTYCDTNEIRLRSCDYIQSEALLSYLPLGYMSKKIFSRAKRNVLTYDLGALYPFTSFELNDEDGVFLGINETNHSLVSTDFFDGQKYMNANISILGTTGAGKTFTLQLINTRFRRKGIQTFVIAPHKGHEFKRCCDAIDGEFIRISPSSSQCINVMEIRKIDTSANDILDGGYKEDSLLAQKIESLHIFFRLLIPDINAEEEQLLDEALVVTYAQKGITHDNDSLFDPTDHTKYREMPILGDVYDELIKNPKTERIANIMNRLVHGSARSFNQQTNVDLDNLYIVIDISQLDGSTLLPVGMYIALDYVFSRAKENRLKRKAIVVDEAWKLMSANELAANYVLEMFKIIRGYGGSAICATQDLNDFFAFHNGKYGKGVINASKTKIILKLEKTEAMMVKELLDLSEEEYEEIMEYERGHGLLSTNNNNISIDFKASDLETALITTDRKELERLYAKNNEERE